MKKLYVFLLTSLFSGLTGFSQMVILEESLPKYGCPNTTHDVTFRVTNNSGITITSGYADIEIIIRSQDNSTTYKTYEVLGVTGTLNHGDVAEVLVEDIPFEGAMICNVTVNLSIPSLTLSYSNTGTYTVGLPPNLTITENPSETVEVTTSLDGYSVRFYKDANYTTVENETVNTTFAPSVSGSYTAKAYEPISGCISAAASNAVSITVTPTTSLNNKLSLVGISVFPNPVTSFVTITSETSEVLSYELMNIQGVVIKSNSFTGNTSVTTNELPFGSYVLTVKGAGNKISTYNLVK